MGQRHVTQTLENAIRSNRVAHAYIFAGVRGVGKTTTARILAKAMNCEKGPTPTPCNECASCREITAGTSLDVLEIDAASNRGIDQIRELREMVRYAAMGRYKIVILDEAHQLTDEASNALLKTLEEPPEKVIFILATTQPEDLADTIKSRAQLFQFRALTFSEISDAITRIAKAEKLKIDSGAVAVIARAAEGSLRDSLSLLEQAMAYCANEITDAQVRELLGVVAEDILDELVGAIHEQSTERTLSLVHRLIADGHNLQHFCREAIRHVRNLLVARICGAESELITAPVDERPRLAKQAALFSEEDLTRFFQILIVDGRRLAAKARSAAAPGTRAAEIGHRQTAGAARRDHCGNAGWRNEARDDGAEIVRRGGVSGRASGAGWSDCCNARGDAERQSKGRQRRNARALRFGGGSRSRTRAERRDGKSCGDGRADSGPASARGGELDRDDDKRIGRRAVRSDQSGAAGAEIFVVDGRIRDALGTGRKRNPAFLSDGQAHARGDVAGSRCDGTIAHRDQPGDRTAAARLC